MTSNPDSKDILDVTFSTPTPEYDGDRKAALFELLGQAHMIPLLHEFESRTEPHRFSELRERLDAPETTLTDRLRQLTELGFVTRTQYDEIPPRVEYTATEKTLALAPAFEYLSRWGIYYD